MNKIIYKSILTLILTFVLSTARASINEVSCTGEFSNTCNQCFKETTNMYPGYGFPDLSDTWVASNKGEYIYPDENPTPVTIKPFYTSGELEQKLNFSYSYSNLSDGNFNNGEIRQDGDGVYYIDFLSNSIGKILVGNDSFIKFAGISNSIKSNGRAKPLLEFQYNFNYYPNYYNNGNKWESKKHSECILYYPSRCGDGVLDTTYGETCDDGNNISGDGCDATCKAEPPKVATCDSLTTSPVSGYNPFSSVLTCSGTNATSYNIDCGNGQTINSSNGTCNYNAVGTYTASCKVNGSITSPSCSKTIMSLTPPPPPSCNALSITPISGNSPMTSTFTCQGINATGYKIDIKNSAGTVINTINTQVGNYTFTNAGNYTATCTISSLKGDKTSPSCNGNITVLSPPATCTSGGVSGTQSSTISATTPNLCQAGVIVGGFVSSVSGNTINYTWSCGGISGGNCSASYTPGTPGCTSGGVTGAQSSTISASTSGLCQSGVALGSFGSTTLGTTTNYTWSCGGISGGNCSASYDSSVVVTPTCNNLAVSPTTGTAPLASNFSCSGNGTITSYKIDIFSGSTATGTPLQTINNSTGSYIFNNNGTYSAKCILNGNISSASCQKDGTINVGTCENGGLTGTQSTTINSSTPLLCKPGFAVGNFVGNTTGTTTNYTWSCGGISGGNCSASYTPGTLGCTSGGVSGTQSSTISAITSGLCQAGVIVGGFVSSVSGNTTNYTWSCGGISGGNCSASYTSGGGGGGSPDYCFSLSALTANNGRTVNFDCQANGSQYTIDIRDSSNTIINTFTNIGGTYNFTGDGTYTAQCYVGVTNTTSPICKKSFSFTGFTLPPGGNGGGGTSSPYCGDGNIDRPNSSGFYEECDDKNTNNYDECNNSCSTSITEPNGGIIKINPFGSIVLGNNMNVFSTLGISKASITNTSTVTDFYYDGTLCINNKSTSLITSINNKICSSPIGWLPKNGGKKIFNITSNYITNTSGIPFGKNFADGQIVTTLDGLENTNSFLNAILNVRVSKSSVSVRGGGASMISNTNISDVNKLSTGNGGGNFGNLDPNKNKNVVLTSLGTSQLSSFSKTESIGTTVSNKALSGGIKDTSSFNNITTSSGNTNISTLPTQNYNGIENVFIHKGKVTLPVTIISGTNRTYIIEDGNLELNGNITSDKNILFVVKGGNIIISNDVTKIDAILISIPKGTSGGNILGYSPSTNNQLTVNGALYGNVGDLLSNRTYIKGVGEYVEVGTNINFTSKILQSPPPLLTKFLGEYLETNKVPK